MEVPPGIEPGYTEVESQIRTSDVTDLNILGAFRRTARENFVPTARKALAYADCQVETDEGRVMLSPRDLSKMIQAADIKSDDVVLDLACGRGYSTAILAQLSDTVVGLETNEAAVAFGLHHSKWPCWSRHCIHKVW